jgi:hypothetical protein
MSYLTFPFTPLPADLTRTFDWGENETRYDSGEYQTDTNYVKPLMQYDVNVKLMLDTKQAALKTFVNSVKGRTQPFLMKDPYDYQINSTLAAQSGVTNAATLFLYDTNGFMVRADTTTIGSLFSALSGYVRLGTQFSYEQDTGILTVNTKATADVWGVRSATYYRKCKFVAPYAETSALWNIFSTTMKIAELP